MPLPLSERARTTPQSPIRKLAHLAQRAKKQGTKVYHLNIGQPDIEAPEPFLEGLRKFSERVIAYEHSEGNERLRRAWAEYAKRTIGLSAEAGQYLITTGASEALVFLFMSCCDPGDEVIVLDPTYANYIGFAATTGVNLVPVPNRLEENFALPTREEIAARITHKTHGILLCNPNNPTGTVYTKAEVELLLEICESKDLFLMVDETYREFVYDDHRPFSVLQLSPDNQRVVVVDSLSKRFSLCGARLGAIITPNEKILAAALNLAQARLASPTVEQFAAANMLENLESNFVDAIRDEYCARRNTLFEAVRAVPGVTAHRPEGAFYTVVGLPVESAEDFATFLLSEFSAGKSTVFIAPAQGFYIGVDRGKNESRLAYVLNSPDIQRAVELLDAGLKAYRKRGA